MKMLIVNDNKKITKFLSQYFLKFYEVTVFYCPAKALIHYATYCEYDIIFFNYQTQKLAMNEFIEQVLFLNPGQRLILSSTSMNNKLIELAIKYEDNIYLSDQPSEKEIFKALCGSL